MCTVGLRSTKHLQGWPRRKGQYYKYLESDHISNQYCVKSTYFSEMVYLPLPGLQVWYSIAGSRYNWRYVYTSLHCSSLHNI